MSSLSDHAYPMHLHLYSHIAQLNLCLSSLGLGVCLSEVWAGAIVPFFCRPRFSRAMGVELRHSMEHGGNTRLCFGPRLKCNYRLLLLRATGFPMAWASTKGFSVSLHEASRQSLYPWLPPWGKSLVVRWAVFQHAVGDIAGTKIGFIVTFFIKSINSPTNHLNAFSGPLL